MYPWESASTTHLMYRMTDDEFTLAVVVACQTPRTIHYLDSMRNATRHRRDSLGLSNGSLALSAICAASEAAAARESGT